MRIRCLFVLGLLLTCCGQTAAQSLIGKPFIAVKGTASSEVVPDRFPVTVTVAETSQDAAGSQARVESTVRRIAAELDRMKVPDNDVEIGNLDIEPVEHYDDETEREVFVGNEYQRRLVVTFKTLADVQHFVGKLPKGALIRVSTGEFTHSRQEELQGELMAQAITNAKRRAETLAKATGTRLLDLHNVSDRPQGNVYSDGFLEAITVTGTRVQRDVSIVLKEGTITLSAHAYLVYLIGE